MGKPELDGRMIPAEKVKHYDFTKRPSKPAKGLIRIVKKMICDPYLKKSGFTLVKEKMEGLKPPYVLLCNHMSFVDFYVLFAAISPEIPQPVVAIDAIRDVSEPVMKLVGTIGKRKFVQDLGLIRHMKHVLEKRKGIVCLYPEARYSLDGTQSFLPDSVGKLCKLTKVPVVTLIAHGDFIAQPQWNKEDKYLPISATISQIVTADEIKTLSAAEINRRIREKFVYDDFKYQKDNGYIVDNPRRANGLHSILYQCAHCGTEFEMYSEGTTLECKHCGKKWEMTELGELKAHTGETEFTHIPDWFKWERENVRREVESGNYSFDDEVEVHTLPNARHFYYQGKGRLKQSLDGTTLECNYHGKELVQHWSGAQLESVHVEYDYPFKKKKYKLDFGDCLDISIPSESFWLHPTRRDQLTKFSMATEEIYRLDKEKIKK